MMRALKVHVRGRVAQSYFGVATLMLVLGLAQLVVVEAAQSANRTPPMDYKPSTMSISFASEPSPLKTGENAFDVILKNPTGKAITDADVSVAFRMPAMPNMPEMRNTIPLKHAVAGRYSGTGQLAMAGPWEVTVVVRRGDKEIGNKKFKVTVQ